MFYVGEERTFIGPEVDGAEHPIVHWQWNFGDGIANIGQVVTHVYTTPGTYIVTLQTQNSCGELSDVNDPTCSKAITISEGEPVSLLPLLGIVGSIITGASMMLG